MKKIYIVRGSTGEYDDWKCWPVAAYLDKENAELHAELAQKRAAELIKQRQTRDLVAEDRNEFDPGGDMDYTGNVYIVQEVPLLDAVPGACSTEWSKEQQEEIEPMYRQWIVTIEPDTDRAYTQLYVFPKPTSKTDVLSLIREHVYVSTTDIKVVPAKDQDLRWSTQDPRWKVYSRTGAELDQVHYPKDYTEDKVRTSLIDEYGYPAGITVKKCK